jgi:hypothetical protein
MPALRVPPVRHGGADAERCRTTEEIAPAELAQCNPFAQEIQFITHINSPVFRPPPPWSRFF